MTEAVNIPRGTEPPTDIDNESMVPDFAEDDTGEDAGNNQQTIEDVNSNDEDDKDGRETSHIEILYVIAMYSPRMF